MKTRIIGISKKSLLEKKTAMAKITNNKIPHGRFANKIRRLLLNICIIVSWNRAMYANKKSANIIRHINITSMTA